MIEGLNWLRKKRGDGYCVTFAHGLDRHEMLSRMGGDPLRARWLGPEDFAGYRDLEAAGQVIQVGLHGEWAFAYESNGMEGTDREVLRRVSENTVAVTVYCNINATTLFCSAENGQVLDYFSMDEVTYEPVSRPHRRIDLHKPVEYDEDGIEIDDDDDDDDTIDPIATMFAFAKAAGVTIDREVIAEKPLLSSILLR